MDRALSDATAVACQAIGGLTRAQTRAGEVLASRGAMLDAVGERYAALEDYRAAIALDGGCAAALYNAGTSFLRKGMVADGHQQLSLALRADPLLLPAYVNRALARARQNECAQLARGQPLPRASPLPHTVCKSPPLVPLPPRAAAPADWATSRMRLHSTPATAASTSMPRCSCGDWAATRMQRRY